jgi:iron-sulfur cluster repair protein YtfE (RIC family)
MNEITEVMSRDHDRLDEILRAFHEEKGRDLRKAEGLFSEFKAGLENHIDWEEDILFPIFENRQGGRTSGPTAVMRMEHLQIKNLLAQIVERLKKDDPDTGSLENDLVNVLTAHNKKEEEILYPWIDQSVTDEEREEVLAEMEKVSPEYYAKCWE